MSIAAPITSASERPLRLRKRGDLVFCRQLYAGRSLWAVKDPASLKYFHLREEEYAILHLLDGQATLEDLRRHCNEAFAPRQISSEQVQAFLSNLHRYGLVVSEAPGQGEQLLVRQSEKRRRQMFESAFSVLAIRLPGINPRRLLDWLTPAVGWIFSPAFVALALLLAVAAAALVAVEFRTVEARLPDFDAIVSASNLPWLAVTLAAVKILHELGHAVACRRLGSDCHELGVMLLVFTPCLYCNVSDSWMLPGKWRRIAIAAAGMYVELILAAVCTFLWWFSQPGLFNALCLNTVLICSLGTVLLNGNPLLRYDGYFILADLVEVPNLRSEASAALRRIASRWVLGLEQSPGRLSSGRSDVWLALYALASAIYRWVVVVLVLWVLDEILRPLHLEVLVVIVAGVAIGGMLWPAIDGTLRWARDPSRRRRVAGARLALAGFLVFAGLAVALFVPLPMHVTAPLVLEYRDAQRVYVTVPGTRGETVHIGQQVQAGETLAALDSPQVRRELVRLTSERDQQKLLLANLEARRLQGSSDGAQIPAARAALADLEQRLEQVTRDAQRLTLVAPRNGTVLPPPNVLDEMHDPHALATWTGTPLDDHNRGALLETGTLFCLVGDPHQFEAILHVDEDDVELVQAGQAVDVRLDHLPGETFRGQIVEVAKLDLDVMPRELAAEGDLPVRTDRRGVARPLDTWYQARVRFDEDPPNLVGRADGRARISVTSRTLAARIARYLKQTFAR